MVMIREEYVIAVKIESPKSFRLYLILVKNIYEVKMEKSILFLYSTYTSREYCIIKFFISSKPISKIMK